MHREHFELRDAVHVAHLAEAHRPGALAVELEDEPPEPLRFALRPLDLRGDGVSILRAAAAEERFDFGVVVERAQPIDVAGGRPPQVDHRAVATASRSRTRTRDRLGSRLPSATPTRISPRPPSAATTKPTPTPTSRAPVTRSSWKKPSAINALKIGTAAWMIDASPESSRVSPHESSQNGRAVLTRPTTSRPRQCARSSASVSRPPIVSGTNTASTSAAR